MDFSTETITILRRGGDSWLDTLQNRHTSKPATLQNPPEMCKESVFEPPILLQNQANPQIL